MNRSVFVLGLILFVLAPVGGTADDDERERRMQWWQGEWRDDYWNRPCEIKLESKPKEFKREVKCKDGVGATWHGEWKEEFWDGPCKVKIEATREEFKEEVKCD